MSGLDEESGGFGQGNGDLFGESGSFVEEVGSLFEDNESITVPIRPDAEGFLGRECPQPGCEGYFKVTPGTGLSGSPNCYCPYCGQNATHDHFYTKEQLEYAYSVAFNRVSEAVFRGLKQHEFHHRSMGGLFEMSMKVTGRPYSIRYYREAELEKEVVCEHCTIRYAIYGVFAFCPDCGAHNSYQILTKNLELAEKELALADAASPDLAEYLVNDALENQVSAFDGFGRETCRVHAAKSSDPAKAEKISFQNLPKVRTRVQNLFGFDVMSMLTVDEWNLACRCFQKRHLLAHKMGVVDQEYLTAISDPQAILGRKVKVQRDEVQALAAVLKTLGNRLVSCLNALP